MRERPSYNLPGYGLVKPHFFDYTREILDFLEAYGHLERLKKTDQLGALRKVYPGAHHTRYEYVIAQLALITELCYLKGPQDEGFQLSSNIDDFGELDYLEKAPSKGEVLQILVVLSNIGHLPSTFAGERAFLHYLDTNPGAKRAFRRGLPSMDRTEFDRVLKSFDIYSLNYFIALFLLNRYRRKKNGKQIVSLCQNILRAYIKREKNGNGRMRHAWELYRSVRRLAYLALDSLYTPVPFSLDLSSIFLSLDHYQKEVFARQSNFQDALSRLEGVMRDSVYLSSKALLQMATTSEKTYQKLVQEETEGKILKMQFIISPGSPSTVFLDGLAHKEEYAEIERYAALSFDLSPSDRSKELINTVKWEIETRNRVGTHFSRFGAEWDPSKNHLRVAAAIKPSCPSDKVEKVSFRIARELAKLEIDLSTKLDLDETLRYENGKALVEFLCRSLWGWGKRYQLRDRFIGNEHLLFVNNGSTDTAKLLTSYADDARNKEILDEDTLHELEVLIQELRSVQYRGLLVAYAGSLVVADQSREIAELDGIIFFLGKENQNRRALIVEAKNMANGGTVAQNDLNDKVSNLGIDLGMLSTEACPKGATLSIFTSGSV